ncbi:MAG: hypothetical protein EA377_05930 [Phycisphaerales bacterium]|nr:MAG: hypothetical protein EA377_05930 [Phycisphaerales bacterium]
MNGLREQDESLRQRSLDTLSRQYWQPIYIILRRRGFDPEAAAELTQRFFADVVFQRDLFERADEARGRLRSLLLTALTNFVADDHRQTRRHHSNGIEIQLDALQREECLLHQHTAGSPELEFERRWAIVQLEEAMHRCRQHLHEANLQRHWDAFEVAILRPAISGNAAPPQHEIAKECGFPSAAHVASALKVVRKRFRILLREVIAETVDNPDDRDAEYVRLRSVL